MRIRDWSADVGSSDLYSVSVGRAGNERQVTNVAAGTEDTDAVNKSQLDEVAGSVDELADTVVQYDDEDKATVTLAGEEGTVIGNVAAGSVSATSMDAINGGQLYGALDRPAPLLEIGRAACRERGGTYV